MTQLVGTQGKSPHAALFGLALAAVLLAGIVGGVIGGLIVSGSGAGTTAIDGPAAHAAPRFVAEPKWAEYGKAWEARYRAQYPDTPSANWAEYGKAWETRYRAQYPETPSAKWAEYGKAWEARYRAQYPAR